MPTAARGYERLAFVHQCESPGTHRHRTPPCHGIPVQMQYVMCRLADSCVLVCAAARTPTSMSCLALYGWLYDRDFGP
jgi:hypothetical protein